LTQIKPLRYGSGVQEFVRAVQQERDQVAKEFQKVLGELEPLIERRRQLEERARVLETVMSTYEARASNGQGRAAVARDRHFMDVAYELIQHDGPMYYEALLGRLRAQGIAVPGRNPGANLIAHMSRDKRFARVGRGIYGSRAEISRPHPDPPPQAGRET